MTKLEKELLEALKRARDELLDPNRGPSGPLPTLRVVNRAIEKAKDKAKPEAFLDLSKMHLY